MTQDNKISVVINTYNAQKHLREVLEAAKEFDEIVICDMESTDDTLAIAREYGCKIVTFPKGTINIVEPARNFAIQHASHKWVLVVDADEVITPQLRAKLYSIIKQPDCPQGLFIPRRNRDCNVLDKGRIGDYQLRFFIKEGTVWPPYVHALPKVNGHVEKLRGTKQETFIHLYENYLFDRIEKLNRYTENEVAKKANKNYGVAALLLKPLWRFFKSYIMDEKYKKGTAGLIASSFTAIYQFTLIAKQIEQRKYKK